MSILYNVHNFYQALVNTIKHNILKIKNEKENNVDSVNIQYNGRSETTEPCRSCTDFRSFSYMRRQEFNQNQVPNSIFFFFCRNYIQYGI